MAKVAKKKLTEQEVNDQVRKALALLEEALLWTGSKHKASRLSNAICDCEGALAVKFSGLEVL